MSLAILFYFLCTQYVSDINISIIRSLRLCCWITTLVVLFFFRCVLEIWCGWDWVVSVLQVEAQRWITTLVVLFLYRSVLEIWCGSFWVVLVLQAEAQLFCSHMNRRVVHMFTHEQNSCASGCKTSTTQTSRTKSPTHNELRTRRPMW